MLKEILLQRGLSHRESEIIDLVARGLTSKQVGDKVFISEKTVKFHITNAYKKLGVKKRAALIHFCAPYLIDELRAQQVANEAAIAASNPNLPDGMKLK